MPFICFSLFATILMSNVACQKSNKLSGKYIGQKKPGLVPEKFMPNIVSTDKIELCNAFSPNGKEFYFTVWKNGQNTLMQMKQNGEYWIGPTVASFSGKFNDVDPFVSSDGKRLYFSSNRPLNISNSLNDSDLWYVEKTEDGNWGEPIHLKSISADGKDDYYTSISNNRTLYFSIFESHGGGGNLYFSKFGNNEYSEPVLLEYPINTEYSEHDPYIAADESYLIFTSNRPGGFGKEDLYISFKNDLGEWNVPINMGNEINSEGYDFCPMLTPDGKFLFFTRNIDRNGDIYWVDAKVINNLNNNKP